MVPELLAAKLLNSKIATDRLGICEGHGHQSQQQFILGSLYTNTHTHTHEILIFHQHEKDETLKALSVKQLCHGLFRLYICEPFALWTSTVPTPSWEFNFAGNCRQGCMLNFTKGKKVPCAQDPSLRCSVNESSPNSISHGAVVIKTVCFLTRIQSYKQLADRMILFEDSIANDKVHC